MAQADPTLPLTKEELGSNDFEDYAAKLFDVVEAIVSHNSGAAAPAYVADHLIWFHEIAPENVKIMVHENGADLELFTIDPTTGAISTPVAIAGYLALTGGALTGDLSIATDLTVSNDAYVQNILYIGADGGGDSIANFWDDGSNAWRALRWDDSLNAFAMDDDSGVSREAVHEGNLKDQIAAIGKEALSAEMMVEVVDGSALPVTHGATLFAFQVELSATTGNSAGNPPSGTYRVQGRANAANPFVPVKRIA